MNRVVVIGIKMNGVKEEREWYEVWKWGWMKLFECEWVWMKLFECKWGSLSVNECEWSCLSVSKVVWV
jgi:hypothetical protein